MTQTVDSAGEERLCVRRKTDSPPPVNKILRVLPLALQSSNPIPGPSSRTSIFSEERARERERERRCLLREGGKRFFVPLKLGLHFSRLGAPYGISVYARNLLNAPSSPSFHLCSRIWPPTRADLLKILPPCSRNASAYPISPPIKTASVSVLLLLRAHR